MFQCDGNQCVIVSSGKSPKESPKESPKNPTKHTFPQPCDGVWTVYGADWCPYCIKTKNLLVSKDVDFEYVDIDDLKINKQDIIDLAGNGHKTIPMIFNGKKFIGGYSDLHKIL